MTIEIMSAVKLPTCGMPRIIVCIASNAWEDGKRAASFVRGTSEVAAVRSLVVRGILTVESTNRHEVYAKLTPAAVTALGI